VEMETAAMVEAERVAAAKAEEDWVAEVKVVEPPVEVALVAV
jgi:hypothetical protein